MTSNPLDSKVTQYQSADLQSRCSQLNQDRLTYMKDWFWFVKNVQTSSGKDHQTIERIDLPTGTKAWMLENAARVKGLIRKLTGGDSQLIEEVYQRAVNVAPKPIPWSSVPIK